MYILYNSKNKKIYRIVSIVLILLICMFTVVSIPKDKEKKAKAENKSVVKNDYKLDNMDISLLDSMGEDIELDTPENVDGSMENEDDESIEDNTNTEDTNTSENVRVQKTASSTKSNTGTNTKTTSSETEKSEPDTSSEESAPTRENCASNNINGDKQTFIAKVYSLNNVQAKYVTFKLSGTKNAHTDGIYKFLEADTGNYVEIRWSTVLNSAGIGYVRISFPPCAADPQFHIQWAGVRNEDETVALAAECSMVGYDNN